MKLKYLCLVILSCIVFSAKGQGTYTFGKRNTIGVSATVLRQDRVGDFSSNEYFAGLQRIITRKKSLILEYSSSNMKTSFRFDSENTPSLMMNTIDSNGYNSRFLLNIHGSTRVRVNSWYFGLRNYIKAKGSIAPYGNFLEFKTGFSTIVRTEANRQIKYENINGKVYSNSVPEYEMNNLHILNFQMGYGQSYPIVKNLIFTFQIIGNIHFPLWEGAKNSQYSYYGNEYFYRNAQKLYLRNNTFKLTTGIHYAF